MAVDATGVDEMAVDATGVDETAVDATGVDEMAVDETGVDELGCYRLPQLSLWPSERGHPTFSGYRT